jgi:hypothetical protein
MFQRRVDRQGGIRGHAKPAGAIFVIFFGTRHTRGWGDETCAFPSCIMWCYRGQVAYVRQAPWPALMCCCVAQSSSHDRLFHTREDEGV